MAEVHPHLPFNLDVGSAAFRRDMLLWSIQTQCEMQELLAASLDTIAASRELLAKADRVLARNMVRGGGHIDEGMA
jgi:hypothetical protein